MGRPLPVLGLPVCLPRGQGGSQPSAGAGSATATGNTGCATASSGAAAVLPGLDANLSAWLHESAPHFEGLARRLVAAHAERMAFLQSAAAAGAESIWWPFTQHANLQVCFVLMTTVDALLKNSKLPNAPLLVSCRSTAAG